MFVLSTKLRASWPYLPSCLTCFTYLVLLRALCDLWIYLVSHLTCFTCVWAYLQFRAFFVIMNLKYQHFWYITYKFDNCNSKSLVIVDSSLFLFNKIVLAAGWITSFQVKIKFQMLNIFWKYFWRNLSSKVFPKSYQPIEPLQRIDHIRNRLSFICGKEQNKLMIYIVCNQ